MSTPHNPLTIAADDHGRLVHCQHHDPHGIYGWHKIDAGHSLVRTRQLGAQSVDLIIGTDSYPMEPLGDDIFGVTLDMGECPEYRLRIDWGYDHVTETADPYNFLPTLGEIDIHLIREGRHERLWDSTLR